MDIKNRLMKFIEFKGLKKDTFEVECDLSKRYVSNIGLSMASDIIERILLRYPELNANWLITGMGSMIIQSEEKQIVEYHQEDFTKSESAAEADVHSKIDIETIKKLENEIEILKQDKALQYKYISTLEQRIAELEKGSAKKTKSRKKAF